MLATVTSVCDGSVSVRVRRGFRNETLWPDDVRRLRNGSLTVGQRVNVVREVNNPYLRLEGYKG